MQNVGKFFAFIARPKAKSASASIHPLIEALPLNPSWSSAPKRCPHCTPCLLLWHIL